MADSLWVAPAPYRKNSEPSVVLFLPHAAAGVSIRRILYRIASAQYTIRDMDLSTWTAGRPQDAQRILYRIASGQYHGEDAHTDTDRAQTGVAEHCDDTWRIDPTGHIYISSNPQRMRQAINDSGLSVDDLRYLVCVRDPRDALVSLYYLIQDKVHLAIVKDTALHEHYCNIKEAVAHMTVDEYVERYSDSLLDPLRAIKAFVEQRPEWQVRSASYAVLCQAFPDYLAILVRFLSLTLDWRTCADVLNTEDVCRTATLNPGALARCAKASPSPGRHKRDLQPASIRKLTHEFSEILAWMAENDRPQFRDSYQ